MFEILAAVGDLHCARQKRPVAGQMAGCNVCRVIRNVILNAENAAVGLRRVHHVGHDLIFELGPIGISEDVFRETLREHPINSVGLHPREMTVAGLREVIGVDLGSLTIAKCESGCEQFARGKFGQVGPDIIDAAIRARRDRAIAAPMDVAADRIAVALTHVPTLVTEDEFVTDSGTIDSL